MTRIGKSLEKLQVELEENSGDNERESDEDSLQLYPQELKNVSNGFKKTTSKKMVMENKVESDEFDESKNGIGGNPGWADVMQQILRTKRPKHKKTIVLSKAKRLGDIKKKEDEINVSFEIEKVKDEIKTEKVEQIENIIKKLPTQLKEGQKEKKLGIRVKPSMRDRERERMLQKIATKGVVQLFNAVKQQQGEINKKLSEAGPLERKREQVLKNINKSTFLDILMGGSKSIPVDNDVKNEQEENKKYERKGDKEIWNVLRDDFVMSSKLKDWNRENQDEDSSALEDMNSD